MNVATGKGLGRFRACRDSVRYYFEHYLTQSRGSKLTGTQPSGFCEKYFKRKLLFKLFPLEPRLTKRKVSRYLYVYD